MTIRSPMIIVVITEAAIIILGLQGGYGASLAIATVTAGLLAIGFNLIAGFGGRLAFGNQLFFGLGAYAITIGTSHHLWDPLVGVLVAIAVCSSLAYALGRALHRLSGMLFALTTFALAFIAMGIFNTVGWLGGAAGLGETLSLRTGLLSLQFAGQWELAALGAVLVVLASAVTMWLSRSGWGARLQAGRDDPIAAETCSIDVARMQSVAWAMSAAVTAAAGIIFVQTSLTVEPTGAFGFSSGVEVVVPAIVGGLGTVAGPVLGSLIVLLAALLNQLSSSTTSIGLNNFLYGGILVLVVRLAPGGVIGLAHSFVTTVRHLSLRLPWAQRSLNDDGLALAQPTLSVAATVSVGDSRNEVGTLQLAAAQSDERCPMDDVPALSVKDVRKSFGGVTALAGVSLAVTPGEIIGLIGPNGSGKTTLFNCISGVCKVDSGEIRVQGRVVSGLSPHEVARAGVARTYQIPRLFSGTTVTGNVEVPLLWRMDRADAQQEALRALAAVGLGGVATRCPQELGLADRRRLELARAIVTGAQVILLDEVMAGLSQQEADLVGDLVSSLCRDYQIAMVVVEHVMGSLTRVCTRVVVMEQGEVLATGTPEVVLKDPAVLTAYFGEG